MKKVIKVGCGKNIVVIGWSKSESILFPSSAQMQIYEEGDEPFEDCSESYVDFVKREQVEALIEALQIVKESFYKVEETK